MEKQETKSLRERRSVPVCEFRAAEDGERKIAGHAAVFDVETNIGMFSEIVRPGAFARAIEQGQDVRALFNHDENHVLGRTRNGTLRMEEDARGLAVEIDPPDTQAGRDVVELIRRGDVSQMSYAFVVQSEKWTERKGGTPLREVLDLDLYDVSPVTYPAEITTEVGLRSAESVWADHMQSLESQEGKSDALKEAESQERKDFQRRVRVVKVESIRNRKG
jgi:HK97 family phage prohead protease